MLAKNERHTAGRILRKTSHLDGDQKDFTKETEPKTGLGKLFQLDIRKDIFQVEIHTMCTVWWEVRDFGVRQLWFQISSFLMTCYVVTLKEPVNLSQHL